MHGRKYEKITLEFLSNALVKMCLPYLKRTTEKNPKENNFPENACWMKKPTHNRKRTSYPYKTVAYITIYRTIQSHKNYERTLEL